MAMAMLRALALIALAGQATAAAAGSSCLVVRDAASGQDLKLEARPSLISSLCTHFIRAGIEWRR